MKVTYNKDKNAYQVIYKNEGDTKKPYIRKQFTAGKTRPTKEERRIRIKELEQWALEQEQLLKESVIELNGDKPILFRDFFKVDMMERKFICNSTVERTYQNSKRLVKIFVNWINDNYKDLYLHQVNKKIAIEFIESFKDESFAYKSYLWVRLCYVFNTICLYFEDSEYKYTNPFRMKISTIIEPEAVNHRNVFDAKLIKIMIDEAGSVKGAKYFNTMTEDKQLHRWAIIYLLALTGIRPVDIYTLKWSQIDFERRTMTITHTKTRKHGLKTVIYLTPHLMDIFKRLEPLKKIYKNDEGFIFYHINQRENDNKYDYVYHYCNGLTKTFMAWFRKKHNLNDKINMGGRDMFLYGLYSLRATVGTILTFAKFNANSIDYLQGHSPKNTTAKYYLNMSANPKLATAEMIDYMAYNVCKQELGVEGNRYAYLDRLEEDKEKAIMSENADNKRLDGTGIPHLVDVVVSKIDNEEERLRQEKERLIRMFGLDAVKAMFQ